MLLLIMKILSPHRLFLKSALLPLLLLPSLASAQYFTDTHTGDVNAGFRKTGSYQEQYEMVVYLGNVSNFLALAPGTQITISNYSTLQLSNMCPDGFNNLQWSVFASFQTAALSNSAGVWPPRSCWYTVPRTNVNVQTTPIARLPSSNESGLQDAIVSVSTGANTVSQQLVSSQGNTNINNNSLVILEPVNFNPQDNLTTFIGDKLNPDIGDFGGSVITFSVENTTPNNFTTASVSDFYVNVPYSTSKFQTFIDPLTGLANGTSDYLGYFTLNPNGTMTFTRAAAVAAPSAGTVSGSVTNGFAGLTVVFTNTASGNVTNWVWNFGNGTVITNTTGGNVTNTYSAAGDYTVTLTVYGPGGSSTTTVGNYIVTSPKPQFSGVALLADGDLVLDGSNCPAGVQYRILTATNAALAVTNWIPVATNYFRPDGTYSYTNNARTNQEAYFRLVSP
jgi:hypothetical protein